MLFLCVQDVVKQSHRAQLQSTELLAKLIESGDPASTAQRHVDSLTEEFFIMSSTYMEMVRNRQEQFGASHPSVEGQ